MWFNTRTGEPIAECSRRSEYAASSLLPVGGEVEDEVWCTRGMGAVTPEGRSFDELVREAAQVDVSGWDFSWLDGRATEERPSWGYQRLLRTKLSEVGSALDLQTGGGEVLAGAAPYPPTMVAVESWETNLRKATDLLHGRGVAVVRGADEPPLPFADDSFELIISRHPVTVWWAEIHRLLVPGGRYFAQHVGPASVAELSEFFLGPLSEESRRSRHPQVEEAAAEQAGMEVLETRCERTRIEICDIGAVVYLLRKCPWWVPDFSVETYRQKLYELHELIQQEGLFIANSTRTLFEARKSAS